MFKKKEVKGRRVTLGFPSVFAAFYFVRHVVLHFFSMTDVLLLLLLFSLVNKHTLAASSVA